MVRVVSSIVFNLFSHFILGARIEIIFGTDTFFTGSAKKGKK